jgi:excinuclease UvrABC nuclease subunit
VSGRFREGVNYVYRCYDTSGVLLYVGCTANLPHRLATHANASFWAPDVAKVKAKVYPNAFAARRAEADAIRSEAPRFNVQMNFPKPTWTAQQFDDYIRAREHGGIPAGGWSAGHVHRVRTMRDRYHGGTL